MKFIFIEPEIGSINKKERQKASYIRKSFKVEPHLKKAIMYSTALGVYIPYLNGNKLDERVLLPGFTDYEKRVQYQTYNITPALVEGENVVGCELGDGWYRGNLGAFNKRYVYGQKTKFACSILLDYGDKQEWIYTDCDWKCSQEGPLQENDLKKYEIYDASLEMEGWNEPGFDDKNWHACEIGEYTGQIIPMEGEPLLTQERFSPKILHTPDGSTVLDFGQNLAGFVEFTVTGSAGTKVSLVMGEALDENGNFTLKNLEGEGKATEVMGLGQKIDYTLKEGRQTYHPHFLISGFQYVKVINWPEEVHTDNFTSIAVYSNLREIGKFTCSNPLVNRLMENIRWSQKSNFVDIPTDCPQRERAGWTGDISVFINTANYLTDTRAFLTKWMHDFLGMQKENGMLPVVAPKVPMVGTGDSSSGWSDAVATIPIAQYWCYGDTQLLKESYEAIQHYVEYCQKVARKNHLFHIFKRRKYYKYIVDTGYHFGEWLEPGSSNIKDGLKAIFYPDAEVATAWFYYTTKTLSDIAAILEKKNDQEKYDKLAKKIRQAYRKEFLPKEKDIVSRHSKYVRPIYMGLAEPEEECFLAKKLNQLCIENGYKIGTGFLTTYQILNVLSDHGYVETAYHMLEQKECPGWLYEITLGATTVWEGWTAIQDGKLNPLSLNHYAPGAAMSWLFSHCAGIRPKKPGYAEIEIRPMPGGTLTYARAEYKSTVGLIISDWKIESDKFILNVKLPSDIPATIIMPDGQKYKNAKTGIYVCKIKKENKKHE